MKRWARVLILLIILAAFWQVTGTVFRSRPWPFDSDEAIHALEGLQLAADLRHGQWAVLLRDVYYSLWYPPLYPLTLAPFFLVLGPSYWVARLPGAFLTAIVIALTYRAGRLSARGRPAGLIAATLLAASPFVWINGSMCMEEILAWVCSLMVLVAFVRNQQTGRGSFWVGFWLAFTLLARLSFGIFATGAVGLALALSGGRLADRLRRAARMLWFFGLACFVWWVGPGKLADFQSYLQASTPAYDTLIGLELLRFWEQVLTSFAVGPLLGGVALLAVATAWWRRKDPVQLFALSVVLNTWLGVALKRQVTLRFFALAVPAVFILAGAGIAEFFAWFYQKRDAKRPRWLPLLLALPLLADLTFFGVLRWWAFPFLMEVNWETDAAAQEAYTWLAETTRTDAPLYFVNGWDPFSSRAYAFSLYADDWPNWQRVEVTNVVLADLRQDPGAPGRLAAETDTYPRSYLIYLGNTPVPNGGAWPAYEAELADCFPPGRTAEGGTWLRVWDPAFEEELIAHPGRYLTPASRDDAREKYWYNLFVEMRTGVCLN